MYRRLMLLALAASLCGCLHPHKYDRPALPVPPTWPDGIVSDSNAPGALEAINLPWRDFFTDAKLQSVIELALANNRDLRMAALNIEKAQALYRIQRAEQIPTVGVSAAGNLYRLPEKATVGGFSVPQAVTVEQYTVNLGVSSWELDLFGRVRSLKSQALEQYMATEQARAAAQIALVAAVANSYLTLAADREGLRLAQATLDAQQASHDLVLRMRDAGIASDLELNQTRTQVESARADTALFAGRVGLDENLLNLLVGSPVAAGLLPAELGPETSFKKLSSGLTSDVLLKRPDILMAEHQMKAAYANIGAARAAFFPRIALTAGTGFMSSDLSALFTSGAGTWNFAPQVDLPIFDSGSRKANLRVAEVNRDLAIADYEKAIQTAFREVSDSLTLRTRLMEQQDAQAALLQSLEATYQLSDARYKAGIDSYLSVLVAQRSLYGAQQAMVSLRMARLNNLVTLYKVLGGGA